MLSTRVYPFSKITQSHIRFTRVIFEKCNHRCMEVAARILEDMLRRQVTSIGLSFTLRVEYFYTKSYSILGIYSATDHASARELISAIVGAMDLKVARTFLSGIADRHLIIYGARCAYESENNQTLAESYSYNLFHDIDTVQSCGLFAVPERSSVIDEYIDKITCSEKFHLTIFTQSKYYRNLRNHCNSYK